MVIFVYLEMDHDIERRRNQGVEVSSERTVIMVSRMAFWDKRLALMGIIPQGLVRNAYQR